MWNDTFRFVQCVKRSFELCGPVHEYGIAAVAAPFLATRNQVPPDAEESGGSLGDLPNRQPLDDLAQLPFATGSAGTVACLNVLQHVAEPSAVAAEMIRLLAPGGVLLLCSCNGVGHAPDAHLLWRPAPHAFQTLLAPLGATLIGWQGREGDPHSVYAIGCKEPVAPSFLAGVTGFLSAFRQSLAQAGQSTGWLAAFRDWVARVTGGVATGRARADYHDCQFLLHAPVDPGFRHEMLAAGMPGTKSGSRLDLIE